MQGSEHETDEDVSHLLNQLLAYSIITKFLFFVYF
jgi:hypothetical protein